MYATEEFSCFSIFFRYDQRITTNTLISLMLVSHHRFNVSPRASVHWSSKWKTLAPPAWTPLHNTRCKWRTWKPRCRSCPPGSPGSVVPCPPFHPRPLVSTPSTFPSLPLDHGLGVKPPFNRTNMDRHLNNFAKSYLKAALNWTKCRSVKRPTCPKVLGKQIGDGSACWPKFLYPECPPQNHWFLVTLVKL